MSGAAIGWDQTDPADSKNLGLGAGDIRSLKTNLQGGLNAEHIWPDTGGTTGSHRKGSALAFYGAASAVSSADTEGRLMLTSDTSRLYHVGSAVTHFIGGRLAVEAAPLNQGVASKVTQIWTMECGVGAMIGLGSGNTTITFQNTYVTPGPVVVVTALNNTSNFSDTPLITAGGPGLTTVQINNFKNGANAVPDSTYTFHWIAMGFKAG